MPHLAVVRASAAGAATGLDAATAEDLRALAVLWPGQVSIVIERPGATGVADAPERAPSWPGRVVEGDPVAAVDALGADVVRMPLEPRLAPVARRAPSVVVAESTAVQQLRFQGRSGPAHVPVAAVHALRELWTARTVLEAAQGLQCDGWGAWATYHEQAQMRHRVPPLLFFGSRLRADQVSRAAARPRVAASPDAPLRLGFVGRLVAADGPQHAVAASRHLDRWGVAHELVVLGTGPLETRLRAQAGPNVRFLGPVPDGTGWLDVVAPDLDLALLPYRHAHPTGVELELAGVGVPVIGFRSTSLEGHRRFGGFTETVLPGSPRALAAAVRRLGRAPERRRALATRGIEFMARHHAGARREAQVEHLLRVAGAVHSAI